MDYTDLIDEARGSGDSARTAAEHLAAAGAAALPAILEAVANPWVDPGMLPTALSTIYASAQLDVLLQGLVATEYVAFRSAVRAAVTRTEPEVAEALIERLGDAGELSGRRADAARFLGDRGDISAVAVLRNVYAESRQLDRTKEDTPRLAIETVVALAKLGDFERGPYLVELLSDTYAPTRSLAAQALQIAVAPGMVPALEAAANDTYQEVGPPAVEAIFLLRCSAAVDALLNLARGDEPTAANNAAVRANDILGTEFSKAPSLHRNWDSVRGGWSPTICYRLGQPFAIRRLFETFESAGDRRSEVLREIVQTTGRRPVGGGQFTSAEAAQIADRLDGIGSLYRWGHAVDLADIVR